MFSICIPIYNQKLSLLVHELHRQAVATGLAFEILLIDDASEQEYRAENQAIELPNVRYIQLEKNIGRAKIRNLLVEESKFPYLIFMDGDMNVASDDYIRNYIPYMKEGVVLVGGHIYESQRPESPKLLHWKYGKTREIAANSFQTCNFLIDKSHFDQVQFTIALDGYGHEDTLFGIQLKEAGIAVQHVHNPLIHLGLNDANVFLNRTENALRNLTKINKLLQDQEGNYSRLLRTKNTLDKAGITALVRLLFPIFKPLLRKNLLGKHPSLLVFDVYKFGFFVNL
ncbi:glycosyl transferase [Bacteroidia bacterium]|nr:glycosyl transferase [Bacteroidia bacterium]